MKNSKDYTLLDCVAIFLHNGDFEAAQAEIDAIMHEPYIRETDEEFEDYYNTCVNAFIK